MIRNGKPIDHSNVGGLWGSLIAWIVSLAAFVGAFYALSFWDRDHAWVPGLIAMALATLTFMIPQTFLGRSDTVDTVAIHTANPMGLHAGAHRAPSQDRH